ncbi:MAG: pyroglutamyl-peptidase I [Eubacteriales bacterium]|nr:pyroglutamyl-peptidase I [Eubacteriales bacterium]
MSRTILITGFRPFNTDSINPSWEAVSRLPDQIGDLQVKKLLLPVEYETAARLVCNEAQHCGPNGTPADFVLCVGQAGGRSAVTPEMLGINLRYAEIPDEAGRLCKDEKIEDGGPDAIFSTLPVRKMAAAISAAGIPAKVSLSAGSFVCNDVMYVEVL